MLQGMVKKLTLEQGRTPTNHNHCKSLIKSLRQKLGFATRQVAAITTDEGGEGLKELNTVGQEKCICFTGSSMVIQGKKRIKYAAINLEEEVIKGYLDHGSAQHAELHAVLSILKQYENSPKTVYIFADSNYCVNGAQHWMFDLQRNYWESADGKERACVEQW